MTKHILLTGKPGVGKTTLVKKVCELLKDKSISYQGFFTEEVRQGNPRIGFDIITVDGKKGCLARSRDNCNISGPSVGKYVIDIQAFENIALPCFEIKGPTIMVIDEIGKMELFSKKFRNKVEDIFNKPDVQIFATVPVKNNISFVESLKNRTDILLFTVTHDNRDTILEDIMTNICN